MNNLSIPATVMVFFSFSLNHKKLLFGLLFSFFGKLIDFLKTYSFMREFSQNCGKKVEVLIFYRPNNQWKIVSWIKSCIKVRNRQNHAGKYERHGRKKLHETTANVSFFVSQERKIVPIVCPFYLKLLTLKNNVPCCLWTFSFL